MSASTVIIDYTNWKGERRERTINPMRIGWTATQWHPDPQWVVYAIDLEKGEERTFAMADIHSWRTIAGGTDDTPFDAPTIAGGFPLDREEKRVIEAGYQRYGVAYVKRFDTVQEAHDFLDGGDSVGAHSSVAVFIDGVASELEGVQRDAVHLWRMNASQA